MPLAVTIVGAGPVGSLLALLLAGRGYRVRLLERRGDPRWELPISGRSINLALAARGIVALERAGLKDKLDPAMVVMPGRMLHDEHGATRFIAYGQREHEVLYAISRTELNRLLTQAAAQHPGIELAFNQRCVDVDPLKPLLHLHDEISGIDHSESFQVLLGADGAGSAVRGALLARKLTEVTEEPLRHDYKEFFIPATAGGYAFEPHALHIWPRGDCMLIALPNADGSFTATLFLPREGATSFESLAAPGAVRRFFTAQFADATAVLPTLEQQFADHPQSRLGTVRCQRWHHGRILLLGDAAHAIVPFHGQGLNCGFEDCVVLDDLLATSDALPEVFSTFEGMRRPNTEAIAQMALENYLEMRDTVRSDDFARRKALAAELERQFPQRFIPRYSMVSFRPEISYAEAQRRGALQEQILDQLLQHQPFDAVAAQLLLHRAGL